MKPGNRWSKQPRGANSCWDIPRKDKGRIDVFLQPLLIGRGFFIRFVGGEGLIWLNNVYKTFYGENEVHALDGVDLHIPAGKIFGIIGQSGAGKSTLIRCINGLEIPDQGEVIVGGVTLNRLESHKLRDMRKKIGMIFQHFNLLSSRSVSGNIAFPLEIAGYDKARIDARVAELLDLVGLADKATAYPSQLSGGQKQRVGIARALANEPQVLLCDEATSALDPETTKSILQLLGEINAKMGLTIVLITHEMQVIQEICDDVAVIADGKIKEQGRVIDIFTKPKSAATKSMIQGLINTQLPEEFIIRARKNGSVLMQLSFVGNSAHEPIISAALRNYEIAVNILFGKIDHMKDIPFGMLVVEISGEPEQVSAALEYMDHHGVEMEVYSND